MSKCVVVEQDQLYDLFSRIIKHGDEVGAATFFHVGAPYMLLLKLRELLKNTGLRVSIISNDPGLPGKGTGLLVRENLLNSLVVSFVGTNREAEEKYMRGELDVSMCPQDTVIRKLLAGAGAGPNKNLAGVLTRTGIGTKAAQGKRIFKHDGLEYIFEPALRPRVGFIKTWITDKMGNSIYDKVARNFNPVMAKACDVTIAEADYIVDSLENLPSHLWKYLDTDNSEYLDPNIIVTPGCYVDYVVLSDGKWKEDLRVQPAGSVEDLDPLIKRILTRTAQEIKDGFTVNLGIGPPTGLIGFLEGKHVHLQSENGMWRMGPSPLRGEEDNNLINAGRQPVTLLPGGAYFCTAESFDMITGGYVDMTILGAFQVSEKGDLANNEIPGKRVPGFGGAPALLAGAKQVIALLKTLIAKDGTPTILKECTLPLTGKSVVNKIISPEAVLEIQPGGQGVMITEIAFDVTLEEVVKKINPDGLREEQKVKIKVADNLETMEL